MKKAVNKTRKKGETVRKDESTTEAFVATVDLPGDSSYLSTLFILSAELFNLMFK